MADPWFTHEERFAESAGKMAKYIGAAIAIGGPFTLFTLAPIIATYCVYTIMADTTFLVRNAFRGNKRLETNTQL